MVVIQHLPEPARPSSRRVAAWSGAFALHVVVLGVLLAPIARGPVEAPAERPVEPEFALVDIERAVETPPSPRPVEVERVRPRPQPAVAAVPIEITTPIFETSAFPEPVEVSPDPPVEAFPGDGGTVEPSGAAVRLATLVAPPPHYPSIGLRRRMEGIVLLRVTVTDQGRPREVTVERSSGHRVLDEAARKQVLQRWQFVPAMRDGVAVPAVGLVPIQFRIDAG